MVAQVFVNPQRVERRGVKARQEHVDHDGQIHLALLHAVGQVLVVVLEALGTRVEARGEHRVVVRDGIRKEVSARRVQALHIKALVGQATTIVGLVWAKAVDNRHL